jgi:hypothetical protein
MQTLRFLTAATLLAVIVLAACRGSDPSPVDPSPGPIVVVRGSRAIDTVGARLTTPLTVRVTDVGGRPVVGATILFASDTTRRARVLFATPASAPLSNTATTNTDRAGQASVTLRMGDVAGVAVVQITVPSLGASRTDSVSIKPGAPAGFRVQADTAVFIGNTVQLTSGVADRFGNIITAAGTYTSSDPAVSVSSTGSVRGLSFGEATVSVVGESFSGDTRLAIVPRGTIAARTFSPLGIGIVNLDMSNYRYLTSNVTKPWCNGCALPLAAPRWHPDGAHIVFSRGFTDGFNNDPSVVAITDMAGNTRALKLPVPLWMTTDPVFSKDGNWLYFAGLNPTERHTIWRSRADETAPEPLNPEAIDEFASERRPDVSPDGTAVVYGFGGNPAGPTLWIRSLVSGKRTSTNVLGTSPKWSPSGELIAFYVGFISSGYSGELRVMRADGSDQRILTPGAFDALFDWSPDGKYIVADDQVIYGLVVIEVATGKTVHIWRSSKFSEPSWRPVQ